MSLPTPPAARARASLPIIILSDTNREQLRIDGQGLIWNGSHLRGQVVVGSLPVVSTNQLDWSVTLAAHQTKSITIKLPYLPLIEPSEATALAALDFERERKVTGDYWRRVLDESARLTTPEPDLTDFYRAVAGHLLINCEIEPGSDRRFARVGSLRYGVYGNESCMMVLDLDRRGYHRKPRTVLTPGFITRARWGCRAISIPRTASSTEPRVMKPADTTNTTVGSLDAGRALPLHAR